MAVERYTGTKTDTLRWRARDLPVIGRMVLAVDRVRYLDADVKRKAKVQRAQQVSELRNVLIERYSGINPEDHVLVVPMGTDEPVEFSVDFYENGEIVLSTETIKTVKNRHGDNFDDTKLFEFALKADNTLVSTATVTEHMPTGSRDNFWVGGYDADPKSTSFDSTPRAFPVSTTEIAMIKNGARIGTVEDLPAAA